jgi:hypothetical protein
MMILSLHLDFRISIDTKEHQKNQRPRFDSRRSFLAHFTHQRHQCRLNYRLLDFTINVLGAGSLDGKKWMYLSFITVMPA